MSVVKYNGITLPMAFHTDFRQEAVYDESGTDWYLTKFDITVQCLLSIDYVSQIAPDLTASGNAATIMDLIRVRLLKPRKTLSVQCNNVELIPQKQFGLPGTVDAKNGPQPKECNIIQMNNTLFMLSYHIVAHYWEANTTTGNTTPIENQQARSILYNRWSETVEIDNANYSKRIREGKFIIRSDNKAGQIADFFREQMAPVKIPLGCLRESASYTVTPDGLAIQYRIVDKEVFRLPPEPAFEAQGEYMETTTKNGSIRWGEIRVWLKGDVTTHQAFLATRALAVASKKLDIVGADVNDNGFAKLETAAIRVWLYENIVECTLKAMLQPYKTNKRFLGVTSINFNNLSDVPLNNTELPNYDSVRGTQKLLLQAASYYDPSLREDPTLNANNNIPGTEPGQAGVNLEA